MSNGHASVRWGLAAREGACNFCEKPDHGGMVLVIHRAGELSGMEARICRACFKEINRVAKARGGA